MYQVNHVVRLDGKKFYEVSVWNMFCRKKMLSVLLIVIYGLGLISAVTAIPALKAGNTNGFIINAGLGFIVVVMAVYLAYSNLGRLKRVSRNEEYLTKTEKHIKMDEDQIINYRASVSEQISYKWDQVEGAYDRKDDIIFCMKDQQIIVLEKDKLEPKEQEFIRAKADVRMLWKKAVPAGLWIGVIACITAAAAVYGICICLG